MENHMQDIGAVADGEPFPNLEPGDEQLAGPETPDSVMAVANGSTESADLSDATAWFLSDAPIPPARRTFGLNVGRLKPGTDPEDGVYEDFVVNWTVQRIPREKIREIQRMSTPAAKRASGGESDGIKANLGIAAEGTVVPNLRTIAARLGTQDIADVLLKRLQHKPGLIDQIATAVLNVSGYDDDDIRDASVVRD